MSMGRAKVVSPSFPLFCFSSMEAERPWQESVVHRAKDDCHSFISFFPPQIQYRIRILLIKKLINMRVLFMAN